eukprot:1379212-Pyramimonas_sp.AAC.1
MSARRVAPPDASLGRAFPSLSQRTMDRLPQTGNCRWGGRQTRHCPLGAHQTCHYLFRGHQTRQYTH